jgi:hypothetical protein
VQFEEITRVKGAGNSNKVLKYNATDDVPFNGTSYYRLRQTDFNGLFKYSTIATVSFEGDFDYSIFPNPSHASKTFVTIRGIKDETIHLDVYDDMGKEAFSKSVLLQQSGECTIAIEPPHNLVMGIYTVVISAGQNLYEHKLIIN